MYIITKQKSNKGLSESKKYEMSEYLKMLQEWKRYGYEQKMSKQVIMEMTMGLKLSETSKKKKKMQ